MTTRNLIYSFAFVLSLTSVGCAKVGTLTVRSTEQDNGKTTCRLKAKNRALSAVVEELSGAMQTPVEIGDSLDPAMKVGADISDENCRLVLTSFANIYNMTIVESNSDKLILQAKQ